MIILYFQTQNCENHLNNDSKPYKEGGSTCKASLIKINTVLCATLFKKANVVLLPETC